MNFDSIPKVNCSVMVELVTRNYWWPGVTKEVKRYVEGCDQCQRMKNRAEMPAGKLRPNQVPERP